MWDTARLVTAKNEKLPEGQGLDFKDYFQFTELKVRYIPPHRVLAINRGEKENALTVVRSEWDVETGPTPGHWSVCRLLLPWRERAPVRNR